MKTIGIDLGGTNVRAGLVENKQLASTHAGRIDAKGTAQEVLQRVFDITDELIKTPVNAIGIGVPGLIDDEQGLVVDVLNIPSWKKVPLKKLMEERYQLPVFVNNDANCFALGEYYFGKGSGSKALVGLTIGTGLGSGIIINGELYTGANCGAGEFGMIDYLDKYIEYYASGQFFNNVYQMDGEQVFKMASEGEPSAIRMYEAFGSHLGNAIKTILYALDVDTIIIGGSVKLAWPYYKNSMYEKLDTFAYKGTIDKLKIEISDLQNSGILGAAALPFNNLQ